MCKEHYGRVAAARMRLSVLLHLPLAAGTTVGIGWWRGKNDALLRKSRMMCIRFTGLLLEVVYQHRCPGHINTVVLTTRLEIMSAPRGSPNKPSNSSLSNL